MKFPITYKIAFPFLLILILIGSFSFYFFLQSKSLFESADELNQLVTKQTTSMNLRYYSSQLLMATNDYMITKKNDYRNNFYLFYEKLLKYTSELEKNKLDQHERTILYQVEKDIDSTKLYADKIFKSSESVNAPQVIILMGKIAYTYGEKVEKGVNQLFIYNSGKILFAKRNLDLFKNQLFFTTTVIGLAVLIILLVTSYLTTIRIAKPILTLSKAAETIGKGDYSVRPVVNTKDEIATLANAFSHMAESVELSHKSLKQSQQFNESIVKTIPSALIVVSKNHDELPDPESFSKGKVITVNRSFCDMFGFNADEVVGKTIKETLSEINLSDLCKKVVVNGKVIENVTCECNSPRKGKLVLYLSLAGFELGEENILIVITDITELKRAEDTIRWEKERAQSYLDVAGVILLVINADQRISLINKKGCQILGYDESEIIGENWFDNFISSEKREFVRDIFIGIMQGETEKVEYFENEVLTKDGEKIIIAWHNAFIKDQNDKITGTLSSGEDITLRKQAEITAEKYLAELKKLNSQKDKLFSILSHDLRSPFNGLFGYSDMLLNDFDEMKTEEIKSCISGIKDISENIYNQLNNLLEWSRLQRNKIEFNPQKLALIDLVNGIVKLLNPNALKKNISLITEIDDNICVKADKYMLNSVLQNLISNAIKFTYEKGEIKISAVSNNPFVEINITDTGMGMSDDEIDKVFRVDSIYITKGTTGEVGTGLGLVICKEMIEKHGGKINIESQKRIGSSFKFTVPVC
ncbi:MAG: PAS domain S-box protein [Ignavibacteriaceae bacterium]